MKTCGVCRTVLSDGNSNKVLSGKQAGEFQSYCRHCAGVYGKKHRAANPESYNEATRRCNKKPERKAKILKYQRGRAAEFPEKVKRIERNSKLKKAYGISLQDFNRLLVSQKGVCKICGLDITGEKTVGKKKVALACVDHCHTSGKIRGLLCFKCNFILGLAGDSQDRLRAAANYLDKSNPLK